MLKLLKYELIKLRFMTVITLLLTALAQSYFFYAFFTQKATHLGASIIILFFITLFAMFTAGVISIQLFYNELNSKQSYMLFMTPNSNAKIFGAKILQGLIAFAITGIFFASLAFLDLYLVSTMEAQDFFTYLAQHIYFATESGNYIIDAIIYILQLTQFLAISYFGVIVLATLLNGKKLAGFLAFVLVITLLIGVAYVQNLLHIGYSLDMTQNIYGILYNIVVIVLAYLGGTYLMDKKLSV